MNTKKSIVLFLSIALSAACGLVDQTADANKLVIEANGLIVEDNQQLLAADQKLQQLLGSGLGTAKNIDAYKSAHKTELDELAAQFARLESNETQIAEKFRQAAQFKLNEKYKQYLELKTQEFSKEAESSKLVNPLIKSFMEAPDKTSIINVLNEYDTKSEAIRKEVADLQSQSEQLAKDNPSLIK